MNHLDGGYASEDTELEKKEGTIERMDIAAKENRSG